MSRGTQSTAFTVELWPDERPVPRVFHRPRWVPVTLAAVGVALVGAFALGGDHAAPNGGASAGSAVVAHDGSGVAGPCDECVLAGQDDPGELETRWTAHCAAVVPPWEQAEPPELSGR